MEELRINIVERMKDLHVPGLGICLINNRKYSGESYGILNTKTNEKVTNHSLFNACSISKFLTSMLVLRLYANGQVDLDKDINHLLTSWEFPNNLYTRNQEITLRLLLCHQSGIIDPEGSFGECVLNHEPFTIVDLLEGKTVYCTEKIEAKYEPGTDFHYSDAGFCIIQQVVEDVLGIPYVRAVHEMIIDPLQMKNSIFLQNIPYESEEYLASPHNNKGELILDKFAVYPYEAAAGLWTTPSDLAILLLELFDSIHGKSKLGITKVVAEEMISSQGCKEWTGLGIFLDGEGKELEISSLGWGVGFQSILVANPYLGTGVVIMTNIDSGVHQLKGFIGEILNSLSFN